MRYVFDFSDPMMLSLFKLGGYEGNKAELTTWLAREGEANFVLCEDVNLASFLNGLIIKNRGPSDDGTPEPETFLSNNSVFRKLKIALSLQADEIIMILKLSEFTMSKQSH